MKLLRKISLFIIVLLSLIVSSSICKANSKIPASWFDYENLSEEDAIDFVKRHKIDIPIVLTKNNLEKKFTKNIIQDYFRYQNDSIYYNYEPLIVFISKIHDTIKSIYSFGSKAAPPPTPFYALEYNYVQNANGNWVTTGAHKKPKEGTFICYGFGINRYESNNYYGCITKYQPGQFSTGISYITDPDFDMSDVTVFKEKILSDLVSLGYDNVYASTYISPTILGANDELICVRSGRFDYHVMKYDKNEGLWFHKPGYTAVLKSKYGPSYDSSWNVREVCGDDGTMLIPSHERTYTSEIYYIRYTNNNKVNVTNTPLSFSVSISAGRDKMYSVNISNSCTKKIQTNSSYNHTIDLYDSNMDLISSYSGNNINQHIDLTQGIYYIRMNFQSNTISSTINISFSNHTHHYNCIPYSSIRHVDICECGDINGLMSVHTVYPGMDRYRECIYCGYLCDTYNYNFPIIHPKNGIIG